MANNLELQLLLKLNDQMSKGLKSAMQSVRQESNGVAQSVNAVASAASRVKPTGIERMTVALRSMHSAAKSSLNVLQKIAQAGVAAAAGGYVLKRAAERPMSYDRRLAVMANTAFSDRDVAGRIAGKSQMDAGIRRAVIQGGGTPEQAAETLNTLIGSGAMGEGKAGINSSLSLLPALQKFASGTGTDANDLARIVIAAKQNMGISDTDIPALLSKSIRAGQEGGFELNNMAKWLPQQMALAGNNGMKGMHSFETLLAANQVSRITAGTSDEAGNNLVNLLAKINSQDTSNDFKKLDIDLSGSLAAARGKGMNPLDAFVSLVGKVGEKDKKYLELRAKSEKQTGTEQGDTYGAMADIMMAKGIGKTVQDRQALMALIAMIQQKDKYGQIKKTVMAEHGKEGETSFGTVSNTLDYKSEQLGNRKAFASMDALSSVQGPLSKLLDGIISVADAHPKLAAAAYSATTALSALAAVSGVAGIFSILKGGGAVGQLAKGAGSSLLTRLGVTAAFAGGTSLSTLGGVGASGLGAIAGGVGLAGVGGYGVGMGINWGMNKGLSAASGNETSLGSMIYDLLHREQLKPQPIQVVVDVKNGNIVASVNEANSRSVSRN